MVPWLVRIVEPTGINILAGMGMGWKVPSPFLRMSLSNCGPRSSYQMMCEAGHPVLHVVFVAVYQCIVLGCQGDTQMRAGWWFIWTGLAPELDRLCAGLVVVLHGPVGEPASTFQHKHKGRLARQRHTCCHSSTRRPKPMLAKRSKHLQSQLAGGHAPTCGAVSCVCRPYRPRFQALSVELVKKPGDHVSSALWSPLGTCTMISPSTLPPAASLALSR
jgi:hypothetical protein